MHIQKITSGNTVQSKGKGAFCYTSLSGFSTNTWERLTSLQLKKMGIDCITILNGRRLRPKHRNNKLTAAIIVTWPLGLKCNAKSPGLTACDLLTSKLWDTDDAKGCFSLL